MIFVSVNLDYTNFNMKYLTRKPHMALCRAVQCYYHDIVN